MCAFPCSRSFLRVWSCAEAPGRLTRSLQATATMYSEQRTQSPSHACGVLIACFAVSRMNSWRAPSARMTRAHRDAWSLVGSPSRCCHCACFAALTVLCYACGCSFCFCLTGIQLHIVCSFVSFRISLSVSLSVCLFSIERGMQGPRTGSRQNTTATAIGKNCHCLSLPVRSVRPSVRPST